MKLSRTLLIWLAALLVASFCLAQVLPDGFFRDSDVDRNLTVDDSIVYGEGVDEDLCIDFDLAAGGTANEQICWDQTPGEFDITDSVHITGGIRATDLANCDSIESNVIGTFSCSTAPSASLIADSDTYVQYNDGGVHGGDDAFTWDKTNDFLGINVDDSANTTRKGHLHLVRECYDSAADGCDAWVLPAIDTPSILIEGADDVGDIVFYNEGGSYTLSGIDGDSLSPALEGQISYSGPNNQFEIRGEVDGTKDVRMFDCDGDNASSELGFQGPPQCTVTGDLKVTGVIDSGTGTLSIGHDGDTGLSRLKTTQTGGGVADVRFEFITDDHSYTEQDEDFTFEHANDGGLTLVTDTADAGNDTSLLCFRDATDNAGGCLTYDHPNNDYEFDQDVSVTSTLPGFFMVDTNIDDAFVASFTGNATATGAGSERGEFAMAADRNGSLVTVMRTGWDSSTAESYLKIEDSAGSLTNLHYSYSGTVGQFDYTGGALIFTGEVEIDGAIDHDGSTVGFFGTAPTTQPADVGALTDSSGGSTDNTVSASAMDFAQISVKDNTTATTVPDETWTQVTVFDTDGEDSGATADHTNDHITIGTTGVYHVTVSMSVIGNTGITNGVEFGIEINNGATSFSSLHAHRTFANASDKGSMMLAGIVRFAASDTVELWVYQDNVPGSNKDITIEDCTLALHRVDSGGTLDDNAAELTENVNAIRTTLRSLGLMQ